MARREGRSAAANTDDDPWISDRSPELWNDELGDVAKGLLTSAVRCFALNGYHATTTREISTGVGRSPATLYVYFRSKEHALFEIIRTAHEDALAYIGDPAVGAAANASERLRLMVSRYTTWHARYHVAARVAQYDLAALTPPHYGEILAIRRRTNELFRDAIARGIAEGYFLVVDVHRVARAMLSLSIDLVRWYRLDGPDSPEQLGDFYADLALSMVLNKSDDRAAAQSPTTPTAARSPSSVAPAT